MQINWQRVAPVLVSMTIIVLVAIARSYSRALAVLLAVMPISIPLAMYVVYSGNPNDTEGFAAFTGGILVGIIPLVGFMITAHLAARAGWGVWQIIIAGYIVWALVYGLVLLIQTALTR